MDLTNCIASWNCAGGIKSKYDYIVDLIGSNKLSILFVSESELTSNDLDIVKIKDYDLLTSNTLNGPGNKSRLSCYINTKIKYKVLFIESVLDVIALDIGPLRLIGVYRGFKLLPGENNESAFKTLMKTLIKLTKTDKRIIVTGDFNIDYNKTSSRLTTLTNWSIDSGLEQLISEPTRRRTVMTANGIRVEESLIDHVYSNINNLEVSTLISVSDHDVIVMSKRIHVSSREKLKIRDRRKYNKSTIGIEIGKNLGQISNPQTVTLKDLNFVLSTSLDKIAPIRVVRVKENQLISPKLEALKKKRDRLFKKYKKYGNAHYLKESEILSKKVKKLIRKEANRIFQCKAKSPDPKIFWQAVNHSLGKHFQQVMEIQIDGSNDLTSDPQMMADIFSRFFLGKVESLSTSSTISIINTKPTTPITFTMEELNQIMKKMPNKRSHGIDGIPQNLIKDGFDYFAAGLLNLLNNFASEGLPQELKVARIIPLHKKGDKHEVLNYRPISNVSSFSKIFERCLLKRIEDELSGADGIHQHGFKKMHSTETAMLTIQSTISTILDNKKRAMMYSVDLSAAFDLLKPDKFFALFKNKISEGLMFCIMDFLQDRKFSVEIEGVRSDTLTLDRGCVQGSVLGPKLFSLYTGGLVESISQSGIQIVSYADDTYVILQGDSDGEVVKKLRKQWKGISIF